MKPPCVSSSAEVPPLRSHGTEACRNGNLRPVPADAHRGSLGALLLAPGRPTPTPHRALCPHAPLLSAHAPLSPSPDAPALSAQSPVVLATFDGSATDHKWHVTNDPVMGGQSKSTFAVEDGVGKFSGKCAVVPFLKAPTLGSLTRTLTLNRSAPNPNPSPCPCRNPTLILTLNRSAPSTLTLTLNRSAANPNPNPNPCPSPTLTLTLTSP